MGQKVHPYGFRLGYNKTWRSRWYAEREYGKLLHEDLQLKKVLKRRFSHAGVSRVEIERAANKLKINIHTSRPGIIIGRKGTEVDKLKADVQAKTNREVYINIIEVAKPELDAQLVAESIALQLVKRIAFRRAMRRAVESTMRFGARGIKVRCSGRLNGAEIARSEWYLNGQLPLHTLRADIDYGFAEAFTTYGQIGVKCWVYKGDSIPLGAAFREETPTRGRVRKPAASPEAKPAAKPRRKPMAEAKPKPEPTPQAEAVAKPEPTPQVKASPKPEPAPQAEASPKPEPAPQAEASPEPETMPKAGLELQSTAKVEPEPKPEPAPQTEAEPKPTSEPTTETKPEPGPES